MVGLWMVDNQLISQSTKIPYQIEEEHKKETMKEIRDRTRRNLFLKPLASIHLAVS